MTVFIYQRLFRPLSLKIKNISEKRLSLMKFTRYIRKNINFIYKVAYIQNISEKTIKAVIRFCTYDSRKRNNFETRPEQTISEMNELTDYNLLA